MTPLFLEIAWTILLPIFILIGLGAALSRIFPLDRSTLNKLNLYIFVPALVFFKFLHSGLESEAVIRVAVYWILLIALLGAASEASGRILRIPASRRNFITLGSLFPNAGNYGIPAQELAFGATGVAVQAVVVAVHNVLLFTLGTVLIAGSHGRFLHRIRTGLAEALRIPIIYALAAAFLLRGHREWIPEPLLVTFGFLSQGLVPVALLTLGVQLAGGGKPRFDRDVRLLCLLRLVAAPLLGYGLVVLLGIAQPLSAILVVSASLPTAVNIALLAIEFRREPRLAAAGVLWTTLLSAVTVTAVIALVKT